MAIMVIYPCIGDCVRRTQSDDKLMFRHFSANPK